MYFIFSMVLLFTVISICDWLSSILGYICVVPVESLYVGALDAIHSALLVSSIWHLGGGCSVYTVDPVEGALPISFNFHNFRPVENCRKRIRLAAVLVRFKYKWLWETGGLGCWIFILNTAVNFISPFRLSYVSLICDSWNRIYYFKFLPFFKHFYSYIIFLLYLWLYKYSFFITTYCF